MLYYASGNLIIKGRKGMKKVLLFLSIVAMLTACGQKEEAAKAEEATPVVVEQVVEEVSPAAIEETIAVEEAVGADVAIPLNEEAAAAPVAEETIVVEEATPAPTEEAAPATK